MPICPPCLPVSLVLIQTCMRTGVGRNGAAIVHSTRHLRLVRGSGRQRQHAPVAGTKVTAGQRSRRRRCASRVGSGSMACASGRSSPAPVGRGEGRRLRGAPAATSATVVAAGSAGVACDRGRGRQRACGVGSGASPSACAAARGRRCWRVSRCDCLGALRTECPLSLAAAACPCGRYDTASGPAYALSRLA